MSDETSPGVSIDEYLRGAIGQTVNETLGPLQAAGYTVRIVAVDGRAHLKTQDYRQDRVNLTVEHGFVVGTSIG